MQRKFCKNNIVNSINIEDKIALRGAFLIIQIEEKKFKKSIAEKRLYANIEIHLQYVTKYLCIFRYILKTEFKQNLKNYKLYKL